MTQWLGRPALYLAIALSGVTAASFIGDHGSAFQLIAHFRPYLAAAAFAGIAIAMALRANVAAALCLAALVANGLPVAARMSEATEADCGATHDLRLLSLNLFLWHTDPATFQQLIQAEQPDIVLLTELPRDLAPLTAAMPELAANAIIDRSDSIFDVALFSRWPITDWSVDRSVSFLTPDLVTRLEAIGSNASYTLPVLVADICPPAAEGAAETCLRVIGLHAAQPMQQGGAPQDAQLRLAAELAATAPDGRAVLAGDLNLTPWSARFDQLLAESGLADSSLQRPLSETWRSPFPFVGLIVDHILSGPGLTVPCSRIGPDVGSDHLPVIADVVINAAVP